jgi:hypothetical protein
MKTNRFDDEDDGAWRERLAHWTVPEAPPRLEARLRAEVRRRHRQRQWRLWGGRVAAAALLAAAVAALRLGGGPRRAGQEAERRPEGAVALADGLDLDGFEPVPQMTLSRWARQGGTP